MSLFSLNNVSVRIDKEDVVQHVSLTIEAGDVHVLMGPNGSGKSSLTNALMGHPKYDITHGTVLLKGDDITHLPTQKRAQKGLFLSMQHLPEIEGVTLSSFLHKAHQAHHTSDVSVIEHYKTLSELCDELNVDRAFLERPLHAGLSGGEKKLSEALQLAALTPRVALLDEIDSGVDVDALKKVFRVVERLQKRGTGFLLVSHHPSLLEHIIPTHVHVMKEGSIVCSGTSELAARIASRGFGDL